MEWLKNQYAQAKTGDKTSRRKLLILASSAVVAIALLISGQTASEPIRVEPKLTTEGSKTVKAGYVHISGAVQNPGVYPMSAGMRMFELVALAGGFTKKADRDSVNLARTLTDGEQISVAGVGGKPISDGLIHLNKATEADLDKLPGIGPTLASRIIDWRKANGAFKNIEELRRVGGIGDKLFAGIKPLVVL